MKNLLNRTKGNWLIYNGGIGLMLFLLFSVFVNFDEFSDSSRMNINLPFFWFLFFGVLIAPITEELFFRGLFIKHKIKKIVAIIFPIIVFFYANANFDIIYLIILITFSIIISILALKNNNEFNINLYFLIYAHAIIFSIIHYKQSDFSKFATILPMIVQFSIALILAWVTINFGIIKSIAFHISYNFILFIILFLGYQTVETKTHKINNDKYSIYWQKNKILNNENGIVKRDKKELKIKNLTISNATQYLQNNDKLKEKLVIKDNFQKYTITIISKSDSLTNNEIVNCLNDLQKN